MIQGSGPSPRVLAGSLDICLCALGVGAGGKMGHFLTSDCEVLLLCYRGVLPYCLPTPSILLKIYLV
jgi:hypothetical protein